MGAKLTEFNNLIRFSGTSKADFEKESQLHLDIQVSVIIPAYNSRDYIVQAINSALAQTLRSIEVIVIDDASLDDTREIVANVIRSDPRVRLISLPRNAGPGAARNAGLDQARGQWIALLDADDTFAPMRLEMLTSLAEREAVELVADNLELVYPDRIDLLLPQDGQSPFRIDAASFIAGNFGNRKQDRKLYGFLQPLIRRSFLEHYRIRYRELRLAEDYFLVLECLTHGARWTVTRESLYRYRIRSDSLTAAMSPDHLDAMAHIDTELLQLTYVRSQPEIHKAISNHLNAVVRAAVWTRFVIAIRRGDLAMVNATLWLNKQYAPHILKKSFGATFRVVGRSLRSKKYRPHGRA
jgi:glycosyltransferase involved in cell wall biosynthesis